MAERAERSTPGAGPVAAPALVAAVEAWRSELAGLGGPEPLMRPADLHEGSLDLAVAHPSGIAMLLAGRPTRLSHLFREPGSLAEAQRRARSIRAAAGALSDEHGLRACVLAVGLASWREDRSGQLVSTPVLLRPVELRPRGSGQVDYEVDLGGPVRTNPALVRELARRGVPLDAQGLAGLSVHSHGFDPTPSLERLRSIIRTSAPDISVRTSLVITALVDVAPALVAALEDATGTLAGSDLALALAGDAGARRRMAAEGGAAPRGGVGGAAAGPGGPTAPGPAAPVLAAPVPTVPDLAAPDLESVRVLLLDHSQRQALDAVLSGRSLRVEAGPGTGSTQLVAAAVAALVGAGRRVLVVAGQQVELADLADRLDEAGVPDLVADPSAPVRVGPDGTPRRRHDDPVDSAPATSSGGAAPGSPVGQDGAGAPRDASAHGGGAGAQLLAHHRALHAVRQPWGVSALDALHALARLPGGPAASRTPVRLPAAALTALDAGARDEAGAQLREAVALGALTVRPGDTPWSGAALTSPQEAAEALGAVRAVLEDLLPALRRQSAQLAAGSGLRPPGSVAEAAVQLSLLTSVRDALDLFVPAVFERPLTALVDATAHGEERDAGGVRLGFLERRRLVHDARELVRPGVVPEDLHLALEAAEESRRSWQRWQSPEAAGALPKVPQGVPAAEVVLDGVVAQLSGLVAVLPAAPGGGDLPQLPWADLQQRLAALAADAAALEDLPRRTALLAALDARGLSPLLDDLRQRQVEPQEVSSELEHAWWRSVLDAVLAAEPELVGIGHETRAALVAELAGAEERRSGSAAARVRTAAATAHAAGARACRVSSPLALPHEVAPGERFDAVVLVAAHRVGVPEAVLAAALGPQLLVVGDPGGLPPARVAPRPGTVPGALRRSVFAALDGAMPTLRLQWQHRMPAQLAALARVVPDAVTGTHAVPCVPAERPVRVRVAPEVVGRPDEDGVVESPDGEVAAVVEVVAHHARTHPEESLVVVALTRPHARRIADALRAALPTRPDLAEHLLRRGRERFVVTDLERCGDTVRDAVVLTVGFGLTPLGRFVHRFGALDEPEGHHGLAVALTRGRRRLTVVTCVPGQDMDPARLRSPGARALREVLLAAEAQDAVAHGGRSRATSPVTGSLAAVSGHHLDAPGADAQASASGTSGSGTSGAGVGAELAGGPAAPPGGGHQRAGAVALADAPSSTAGGAARPRRAAAPEVELVIREEPADPLLARLAARLSEQGARVTPGATVPDLVVLPADGDSPAVAVLTDLADDPVLTVSREPSAGDLVQRELVLPGELERFGWRTVRLGAVELFRDPAGAAAEVVQALTARPRV